LQQQTVLWWGGLRGSVSIALALSVPITLPERDEIIGTVFGVVLFTLLIQGLTTKPMLEKLQLLSDQPLRQKYLEAIARRVAFNRVLSHLSLKGGRLEIDPEFYRYQAALLQGQLDCIQEEINQLQNQYPQLQTFALKQLREELEAIEVDTYAEFIRAGLLDNKPLPLLQEVFKDGDENAVPKPFRV
jgi:CPA1 family monovalent cation:H+ antiporter